MNAARDVLRSWMLSAALLWFAIVTAPFATADAGPIGSDAAQISAPCREDPTPEHCCSPGQAQTLGTPDADHILFPPFGASPRCVFSLAGGDLISTGKGGDFIAAGGDGDIVFAGAGKDVMLGGPDNDLIFGEIGDDTAAGGMGSDILVGGPNNDVLLGGSDPDLLIGDGGADWIVPGPGADFVFGGASTDTVVVYDLCEIERGEHVDGGRGFDTLILPVPVPAAKAAGIHFADFEKIIIEPGSCQSECVPRPDCSGHGSCAEGPGPGDVHCECETGWVGDNCEWCIGAPGFACPGFDVDLSTSGAGTDVATTLLPGAAVDQLAAPPAAPAVAQSVLDAVAVADPDDLIPVSFSVRSSNRAPSLPRLRVDLDPNAPENLALRALRQNVADGFRQARLAEMQFLVDIIEDAGGIIDYRQAVGAVVAAQVPADALQGLLVDTRLKAIASTDPLNEFEPPAIDITPCGDVGTTIGCGSADHEPADAACTPVPITNHSVLLKLNELRQAGFGAQGYVVGIVDTGFAEHDMLEGQVLAHHNCNVVGDECTDEDPSDWADGTGHGTATHSIVVGNTALGNLDRGITLARSESWNVYPIVSFAGPKAIAQALNAGNQVLLLEVQKSDGAVTHMEGAAEEAFDAGAVVVAVMGNAHDEEPCAVETDPLGLVPNIITAGAYAQFAGDLVPFGRQQVGDVAEHGVIKPDVSFPSFAKGASKECADCLDENGFSSTSGAGPFAASMAVQILDRVAAYSPANTPARDLAGIVHAAMVAFATHEIDTETDDVLNLEGAGRAFLRRPACSRWKFGKVIVPGDETASIDVEPSAFGVEGVRAAIWWPQPAGGPHTVVGLRLVQENASWETVHPTSVFQNILPRVDRAERRLEHRDRKSGRQ